MLTTLLATAWSVRTPPDANSDRYDYLGRAHHVLEGVGPRPLVVYPLRFAFEGASVLPAENLTRPPLWPHLVAPALRLGAGEGAGVIVAALGLLTLLPLMMFAGDRAFGTGAGGFAALAMAASFATVRALWGGGPETWIGLLLYVAWTWHATGRLGGAGLGAIFGTLPWLHPIGWLAAALGLSARVGRSSPRAIFQAALVAVSIGIPWYASVGSILGTPLSPLQSQAEFAKAVLDPGGLGPYRSLEPMPTLEVLQTHTGQALYQWGSNLKHQLLHLDAWLAWPIVGLALVGISRDRALAARDAALGITAFVIVSSVARDPRLVVALLPIACTWAGAGFVSVAERLPRWIGPGLAAVVVLAPWILPLGAAVRPSDEFAGTPREWRDPPRETVRAAGALAAPVFLDSAVLAWRARRVGVLIPDSPATLERLRALPALAQASHMVLQRGTESPWLRSAPAEWAAWLAARETNVDTTDPRGMLPTALVVALDPPLSASTPVYVPEPLELGPQDAPEDLVAVPAPPADREGLRLTRDAARALAELVAAAAHDGVELRVVSAYRSYERQQQLFESAVQRHGVDQQWVAAPGRSEHQLGTTIDFADAAFAHVLEPSFATTAEGQWLGANARRFGFVCSYTEENAAQSGFRPEPWHYRHRPGLFEPTDQERP